MAVDDIDLRWFLAHPSSNLSVRVARPLTDLGMVYCERGDLAAALESVGARPATYAERERVMQAVFATLWFVASGYARDGGLPGAEAAIEDRHAHAQEFALVDPDPRGRAANVWLDGFITRVKVEG